MKILRLVILPKIVNYMSLFKSCKHDQCKCKGLDKYNGYCYQCYLIYLLEQQNELLSQLVLSDNIISHSNNNSVSNSKLKLKPSSTFIPTVEVPDTENTNIQSKSISKSSDSTNDIVNALSELK